MTFPRLPLHRLAALGIAVCLLSASARAQRASTTLLTPNGFATILIAELMHDTTSRALRATTWDEPRAQALAARALARIRDPKFAARDSMMSVPPAPVYPDPAWRLRFRALKAPAGACTPLLTALTDSAVPVRLRAMDLVDASCAGDSALGVALRYAVNALPARITRRASGEASWHAGAHAIVALARMQPAEAAPRVRVLARHAEWHVRAYAARAAGVLGDTATLRTLAADENDNVVEAAVEALSKNGGHAFDGVYLVAIRRSGAQAVRAGAAALKGSPRADVAAAANAQFNLWVARNNASAHDARTALLEAAGRPVSDDKPPTPEYKLPARSVALALGEEVKLRVIMSPKTGGGSFVVRLRGDVAPLMAGKILELATSGYYNGLTWHRVEHDFVIQGGSPGATEYVGYRQFLRDELGTIPHPRGTVGMSTRGHDTGDAQWFVNLKDNARLTKDYTVFGEVIEGIEVVDGILEGDMIERIVEVKGAKKR